MQIWKKWIPIADLPAILYAETLIDSNDRLKIVLKNRDNSKRVTVLFEGVLFSYRWADEGSLLKTLSFLTQHYGVDFYENWSFLK